MKHRSPAAKALLVTAKILVALGLLLFVAVDAALIALEQPGPRRFVVAKLNGALATSLQGKIVLDVIDDVDLRGIHGARGRVLDPKGREVIRVEGLDVETNVVALVRSLFKKNEPLRIHLDRVRLRDGAVALVPDESGTLTIERAFEPRPSPETGKKSRPVELVIDEVRIRHAWAHGSLEGTRLDADVHDLVAALRLDADGFGLARLRTQLNARALPRGANPSGVLEGELVVPPRTALRIDGKFEGRVAHVPTTLEATISGQRLVASVYVPEAQPSALYELLPEVPIELPVSAFVAAHGSFSEMDLTYELTAGQTRLGGAGHLKLRPALAATARADIQNLDLAALSPNLPALAGDANAELVARKDHLGLSVDAPDLSIQGRRLPALLLDARLDGSALDGRLQAPRAGDDIVFSVPNVKDPNAVAVRAEASLNLGSAHYVASGLPPDLAGRASLYATGRLEKKSGRIAVAARGTVSNLRAAGNTIKLAKLDGSASGKKESPRIDLRAHLEQVKASTLGFRKIDLEAHGPIDRASVAVKARDVRDRDIEAKTDLDIRHKALYAPCAQITGRDVEVRGAAKTVRFENGVDVDRLELSGVGEVKASVRSRPGRLEVTGTGEHLDLEKIARLLELHQRPRGEASFDVDLSIVRGRIEGRAKAQLSNGYLEKFGPLEATLDATSQRGVIDGHAGAILAKLGEISATAVHLEPHDGRLSPESLLHPTGKLEIDMNLDLSKLPDFVKVDLPLDRLRGTARLIARYDRTDNRPASAEIHLATHGLELLGRSSENKITSRAEARLNEPYRLKGVDFVLDGRSDGEKHTTDVLAKVIDEKGALASVEAHGRLDPKELLEPRPAADWLKLPIQARLSVPRRRLDELPGMFKLSGIRGEVDLDATAKLGGAEPEVTIVGHGYGVGPKDPSFKLPLDVLLQVRHAARHAEASVDASSGTSQLLHAQARADGALFDLVKGKNFVASARAKLEGFPLETLPPMRERQVRGRLGGEMSIEGLGRDAELDAHLSAKGIVLGGAGCRSLDIDVITRGNRLRANAAVRQPGGQLTANADTGINWGNRLLLEVDEDRPARVDVEAKDFRIGAFLPFVHKTFSELDGKLDADLHAKVARGQKSEVAGQARLREGVVQVPTLGQQFRDINAYVTAESGKLKVEDAQARGTTGRVRAAATAVLDGLRVRRAAVRVRIAKNEKLPLALSGVPVGEAWGSVDAEYRVLPDDKTTVVRVTAPEFDVSLPEGERPKLQQLDDAPNIRFGVHPEPGEFRALPLQPLEEPSKPTDTELVVYLDFGKNVWIRQGKTMRIKLDGKMELHTDTTTYARGHIELSRGMVEVQGKRFEVENGTVTFLDDPANPMVYAVVRYDAPEGYKVFAEYRGRINGGKLTLRSDPPLTNDQIMSLLMFGSPDGSLGNSTGGSGGEGALALGVAGGTATKTLNAAFSDLTNLDVTTRIDTGHGSARPELVFQLSRRVAAELEYAVGEPSPGQSPDRTFLTFDVRLGRRWSADTTFGDHGATLLDLLWRHRY